MPLLNNYAQKNKRRNSPPASVFSVLHTRILVFSGITANYDSSQNFLFKIIVYLLLNLRRL